MARANLLDTKTVNLLALIGNGKSFEVPPFQRDYSWSEEQWEDLWNDIQYLRANPEERHYMGSLVVERKTDAEFKIIDGQQRLATLSVFALAVIRHLGELAENGIEPDENRERSREARRNFIGQKDPVSLTESSKLTLNQTDRDFYQDNLVSLRSPKNLRALPKSSGLLWNCLNWFYARIAEEEPLRRSGVALADLLNNVVAKGLLFIQISVDDDMNAYTVFETLNARGLELSATDLLKNYLFSRIKSQGDLAALERRWRALVITVRQERFPEFLRYHLLCEYRQIRQQRLFKLIRSKVTAPKDVFELIEALENRAELFAALRDVNHSYWIDRPENKLFVRELALFGVKQMTPLVFATWERLGREDFARVMKMLTIISFRHTVIGSRNPNELEPAYHSAAKAVLDGEATTPRQIFGKLESIYVPDERFQPDFAEFERSTHGEGKKLVKYILCRLESEQRDGIVNDEVDPATIEHILPENPAEVWEDSIPRKQWDRVVYRLGNLTLLEAGANREAGNGDYAVKANAYEKSGYRITQEIASRNPEEWSIARLEDRQLRMASRAAHLWRVDF